MGARIANLFCLDRLPGLTEYCLKVKGISSLPDQAVFMDNILTETGQITVFTGNVEVGARNTRVLR